MNIKKIRLCITGLALLVTSGCSTLLEVASREEADWEFIQSTGGIAISLIDRMLHVDCNPSATRAITHDPTLINSALTVHSVKLQRKKNTLRLTVVTGVISKQTRTGANPINLSDLPAGTYSVVYADPDGTTHPLGDIELD